MATAIDTTILTRWTVELLEKMPRVIGERYEIICGELFVTTQPHTRHQLACQKIAYQLEKWNNQGNSGVVIPAPGLVYSKDEAVAPDVVWISKVLLTAILAEDGKLHDSPELVVEVLSPGQANEERDYDKKLKLYSRRSVQEYWIADWRAVTVEIYRQDQGELRLVETLTSGDELNSPLLPSFACVIDRFFEL
ncbi:MAG: Uma2 family endonuclease [Chloroflexota bacterium]|nr:Uma2 family endonuclease [Chloroflexota bacterium]